MKRIFLILLTITATSLVNGQTIKSIGIKGGVAIANQKWHYKTNDFILEKENINGFYSAITLDFLKSKYFNLTTDLGYCEKGSTENILHTTTDLPEGDGTYDTYDTRFNYLAVSPMLKIRYEIAHVVPYVLAGLRLDYQLSYKSDFNYQPIENDFKKTILGANFGAGMEYKTKILGFFIEGQYQYDFTKVLDTASSNGNLGITMNNKAVTICLGLKYYLVPRPSPKERGNTSEK